MTRPAPTRYHSLNWAAYDAALRERGSLTVWFDPTMTRHRQAGRPAGLQRRSDPGVRHDQGPVRLAASSDDGFRREPVAVGGAGLDGAGLHDNMPASANLGGQAALQGSMGSLHLLMDSTGIKVRGGGRVAHPQASLLGSCLA